MSDSGYDPLSTQYEAPSRPGLAFGLSLLAGLLIFVEGLVYLWAASSVSSFAVGPVAGAAASLLSLLGGLAALFGFILIILAVGLFTRPENHVGLGITILVLALVSLLVGGGFYIGTVLGVIGGIVAILFEADEDAQPLPSLAPPPEYRRPRSTPAPSRGRSTALDPSAQPRIGCPACGEIQPRTSSTLCRRCGAELAAAGPVRRS